MLFIQRLNIRYEPKLHPSPYILNNEHGYSKLELCIMFCLHKTVVPITLCNLAIQLLLK